MSVEIIKLRTGHPGVKGPGFPLSSHPTYGPFHRSPFNESRAIWVLKMMKTPGHRSRTGEAIPESTQGDRT
jgi:hypothetical protein